MKKSSQNGFVLAETLVVAVFLMTIFSMIYYYFYPLMGEYEKREVYDSVDDKYSVYWLKRMIEDGSYMISSPEQIDNFNKYGYVRFECKDVTENDEKREMCKTLVNALQVEGCNRNGNGCSIFITRYRLGGLPEEKDNFKDTVKNNNVIRHQENCPANNCLDSFISACENDKTYAKDVCEKMAKSKVFTSGFQDYVASLADYKTASLNNAKYRVTAMFQHTTDNNNYYSYATIEVRR